MSRLLFIAYILCSVGIVAGCENSQTAEGTLEAAKDFRLMIDEFTQKVDDLELEDEIKQAEQLVTNGANTLINEGFKLLEGTKDDEVPVAKSGATLVKGKVVNVVDGDTIDVKILDSNYQQGSEMRVRLILVDTPESKGKYEGNPQPFGLEGEQFTRSLLQDQTVWLELGVQERDPYNRLLAYVWLNQISYEYFGKKREFKNTTVNELLLREGLAELAVYPPNTQYLDEFTEIEEQAKKGKIGIWASGN